MAERLACSGIRSSQTGPTNDSYKNHKNVVLMMYDEEQ